MRLTLRLACLSCLASMLGFAGNLSGWLVDSHCFTSLENNRNAGETQWDGNLAIRYCSPRTKTRSFAVVQSETGSSFHFDPVGNEKAMDLHLNASSKFAYFAKLAGDTHRNKVNVHGISISKRVLRDGKGAPGL